VYPQSKDSPTPSQLAAHLFPSAQRLDVFIRTTPPKDCPHPHLPFLKGINQEKRRVVFFTPRCKLWSCPVCGPTNVALASWRASEGAKTAFQSKRGLSFVTITSHEKLSAGASWWVLPDAWKKLHRRVQRAAGGPVDYYAVPELHQSGRVHLHMLTTATLKKRWWKDNARACGFGYQNDAQEVVAVGGVAAYVTKYLGKTLQYSNLPKGTRRIRASRGWPKTPELPAQDGWTFQAMDAKSELQSEKSFYERKGFSVVIAGSKSAWDYVEAD